MRNTYSNMFSEGISAETIKKKVRELRKGLGLTQQEFADKANIAVLTIQNWEKGVIPKADLLIQLCNTYGVDMDYFTGRLDAQNRDIKYIMDYTGLSEEAIEKLHETKDKNPVSFKGLNLFIETFNNDPFDQSSGLRLFSKIHEYLQWNYIMDVLTGPHEAVKNPYIDESDETNKVSETELYYATSKAQSYLDQHRYLITGIATRLFEKMYEIWPEPFIHDEWIMVEGYYIKPIKDGTKKRQTKKIRQK